MRFYEIVSEEVEEVKCQTVKDFQSMTQKDFCISVQITTGIHYDIRAEYKKNQGLKLYTYYTYYTYYLLFLKNAFFRNSK